MKFFEDKVVIITGAGSGIGKATALLFAEAGADVLAVDVRGERLDELRESVGNKGWKLEGRRVDVSDKKAMKAFAGKVLEERGRVDILVSNAGVGIGGQIKDISLEDWEWLIKVNYWGVVYGIHYFLPSMIERGSGHIVNVASANGLFSMPFEGVYSSSKFAVVGLSETLRAEVAHYNVGVTVVCPGLTSTNILKDGKMKYGSEKNREFLERFERILDKMGADPAVVARAIARGVLKNKAVVKVPFHVVAVDFVHRFMPWLYRWIIAGVSKRRG